MNTIFITAAFLSFFLQKNCKDLGRGHKETQLALVVRVIAQK